MSFWKTFGFHTVSAIDTILESDDYTLDQLLDEEEILQETKSQNKRLIDFLTEPETLKRLVIYITQEPEDENDTKRRFKYPFLACEILASEVWSICDAFYQHNELLDDLYGFLSKDPPLNPMLASYTCRVAGVLLQKKVAETIAYMKERKDIIPSFIKHLGNASIMDLLLKVIACEDTPDGSGVLEWLCKTDLIASLIGKFDPQLSSEVHENASQALVDIVAISITSASSPLIAQLEGEEMIKTLFGYILSDGLGSSLLHGICVIIELLKRHMNEHHDETTTVEQLPTLLQHVVKHLDQLHKFLQTPPPANAGLENVVMSFDVVEPLGFHRLKIIEFFAILVRTNYKCIDNEIIKTNSLNTCLDLFFRYLWNNFLHGTVEQIIGGILDGENEEMKKYLLVDCKLISRIVEANKENESELTKPKGVRRGYMGHLTTISTALIQTGNVDPFVEKLLNDSQEWLEYVKGPLALAKERENRRLADYIAPPGMEKYDIYEQDDEQSNDFNNQHYSYFTNDFPEELHEPDDNEEYDNGEIIIQSNLNDFREDYNAEEREVSGQFTRFGFHIEDDDDDDEEDDDSLVQARLEDEDEDDYVNEEVTREDVWVEKRIEDVEEEDDDKKGSEQQSSNVEVSV